MADGYILLPLLTTLSNTSPTLNHKVLSALPKAERLDLVNDTNTVKESHLSGLHFVGDSRYTGLPWQ